MKRNLCLIAGLLVAGCSKATEGGASEAALPRPGQYQITMVREVIGSSDPMKEEASERCLTKIEMDKFHAAFAGNPEVLPSCRDFEKEVGEGRFSVKMICDAPDGDLTNLPGEIRGTYSADGFEIVQEVTVVRITQRETNRYSRLGEC